MQRVRLSFVVALLHWQSVSSSNMSSSIAVSLPYKEASIEQILILSLFFLLLNLVDDVLDRVVYCGLLGQVLLGIAFGTPGAQWLHLETEEAIVQLGYLGLTLIVYEGTGLIY